MIIGLALALVAAFGSAWGQRKPATTNPEFDRLAKQAAAAREANRAEEAIGLYQKSLKLKPRWDEGWWYLGTLYYDSDRYKEALPAFRNLVGLSPNLGPGWALLGLCEFETGDYRNALVHLQMARARGLAGNEELVNVTRFHEALVLDLRGDFEGATKLLSSLVARSVMSIDVKVGLGLALLRVPLLPAQVDPSKDALIHEAGEVAELIALSNFDQADTAFQSLIKNYPSTPFIHYAYGSMLSSLSRYGEAENQLLEEIKITPESSIPPMALAYVYLRENRFREALPLGEKAVLLAPQSFAAHYLLGRALLETGDVPGSIRELETARRLGPLSPEVRYNLARAYSKAKRKVEAERERAEFARLNRLFEREQKLSGPQTYRASGERGALEPRVVEEGRAPPK